MKNLFNKITDFLFPKIELTCSDGRHFLNDLTIWQKEAEVISFVPELIEDNILFSEIAIRFNQYDAYNDFYKRMDIEGIQLYHLHNCEGIYNLLGAIDNYSLDEHF
jgi:hypothetical protein